MLDFLRENWVTIVTLAVLALCVFLALRKVIRDKKEGIGSCGCKCSDCPHSGNCHPK